MILFVPLIFTIVFTNPICIISPFLPLNSIEFPTLNRFPRAMLIPDIAFCNLFRYTNVKKSKIALRDVTTSMAEASNFNVIPKYIVSIIEIIIISTPVALWEPESVLNLIRSINLIITKIHPVKITDMIA